MKKIKKLVHFNFLIAIAIQLGSLQPVSAQSAASQTEDKIDVILGGGSGHDVPTPFQITQTRFELADGETYSLVGTIVFIPTPLGSEAEFLQLRPYFSLNLKNHPLLANAKRVISPLYLIQGNVEKWKKWESRSVNLLARAHGKVHLTSKGLEYFIYLEEIDVEAFSYVCPSEIILPN
jgi:hypothetical protein